VGLPLGALRIGNDLPAQAFSVQLDTEHDLRTGVQTLVYCILHRISVNFIRG
jgi:hypothetical protein